TGPHLGKAAWPGRRSACALDILDKEKIKLPPGLVLSFPMGPCPRRSGFRLWPCPPWLPMEVRRVQRHGGLVWIHPIGTGGDDQAGRSPAFAPRAAHRRRRVLGTGAARGGLDRFL